MNRHISAYCEITRAGRHCTPASGRGFSCLPAVWIFANILSINQACSTVLSACPCPDCHLQGGSGCGCPAASPLLHPNPGTSSITGSPSHMERQKFTGGLRGPLGNFWSRGKTCQRAPGLADSEKLTGCSRNPNSPRRQHSVWETLSSLTWHREF